MDFNNLAILFLPLCIIGILLYFIVIELYKQVNLKLPYDKKYSVLFWISPFFIIRLIKKHSDYYKKSRLRIIFIILYISFFVLIITTLIIAI